MEGFVVQRLATNIDPKTGLCRNPERLAEIEERLRIDQRRLTEVHEDLLRRKGEAVDDAELTAGLAAFGPIWTALEPAERTRLLGLLIEKIVYHGRNGSVELTFRPTGIKELARGNKETHQ